MKLYFSKGACSLAPRIIVNELELPCEFESVDLASKKTQAGKNFYTINPKGYVPVLITDDGETLTENATILQYLADKYSAQNLLPVEATIDRYRVLEWVIFVSTELHKKFGTFFNSKIPQEINDQIFRPMIEARLGFINQHLEKNEYLAGDHFTLPDAYLFVILRWAHHFKFDSKEWSHLSRYFKTLLTRKSIKQSLNEEGLPV